MISIRSIVVTFIFFMLAFFSFASSKKDTLQFSKFGVEINSGAGFSFWNSEFPVTFSKPQFSYCFGLGATYFFNNQLFLSTSINYKTNSFLLKDIPNTTLLIDEFGNVNYDRVTYFNMKEQFSYLSLPVSFNYKIPANKKISFVFSTGIGLNYLNKVKWDSQNLINNNQNADFSIVITNKQLNNRFNRLSPSVSLGIGAMVRISPILSLNLKTQYNLDLNPIVLKTNKPNNAETVKFCSFLMQASLLYLLPIK